VQSASIPANEFARLEALRSYRVLDTPPEEAVDAITRLASSICGVPIALVSLLDTDRQWFLSAHGLSDARQTPRNLAFCAHAILTPDLMVVTDALNDPRFADNPLVTEGPHIRFYAGMPLVDDAGFALGTLCVLDRVPRTLSSTQKAALADLAVLVVRLFEARRNAGQLALLSNSLIEAKEDLSAMVDHVPAALGYLDRSLRNRFSNQAFLKWFGITAPNVAGVHISELVGGEAFERDEPFMRKVLLGEPQQFECSLAGPDGEEIHGQISYIPDIRAGSVFGFFILGSDITQHRNLEIALSREREQAVSAREAALAASRTKSLFLANMSHELRTPLNGALGMLELALDTPPGGQQREFLTAAHQSADNLLDIINDILDVSKIEASKLEIEHISYSVEAVLKSTFNSVAQKAHAKGLELVLCIACDVPELIVGDPARVRQVLTNLIANATKFTAAGEVVTRVSVVRSAGHARLRFEVQDTGIGIAPEHTESVFHEFSQADSSTTRKFGGTGLGLTICRELAALMGGQIGLDSQVGAGSTFWVELPLYLSSSTPRPVEARKHELAGVVLVVEDHGLSRRVLVEALTAAGLDVRGVQGAEEALSLLRSSLTFSAVVIDSNLSGEEGLSLARAMQTDVRLAPVWRVLLTSHEQISNDQLDAAGIARSLAKPVLPSELLRALHDRESGQDRRDAPSVAAVTEPAPARVLRVLVADDHRVNAHLALELLRRDGHQASHVWNGAFAVEAAMRDPYDVILMDVEMPEMDGIEATRRIRAHEHDGVRRTAIIAVTAKAMTGDRDACTAAGMDGYLAKPVNARTLRRVLQDVALARTPDARSSAPGPGFLAEPTFHREELCERASGDLDLARELVEMFSGTRDEMVLEVAQGVALGDAERVRRAAHRIKGALQVVSARRAAMLALKLEEAGRGSLTEQFSELVEELQRELQALDGELATFLASVGHAARALFR